MIQPGKQIQAVWSRRLSGRFGKNPGYSGHKAACQNLKLLWFCPLTEDNPDPSALYNHRRHFDLDS